MAHLIPLEPKYYEALCKSYIDSTGIIIVPDKIHGLCHRRWADKSSAWVKADDARLISRFLRVYFGHVGGQGHHYILYYTDILHEKSSLIAPRYGALCKKDIIVIIYVQESRKEKALGLMKFFPALAYNFCLTFACRIVTTWGPPRGEEANFQPSGGGLVLHVIPDTHV